MPYGSNFWAVGGFLVFGGNDFDGSGKIKIWRYFFGGNFLAVGGFSFFGGNDFGGSSKPK